MSGTLYDKKSLEYCQKISDLINELKNRTEIITDGKHLKLGEGNTKGQLFKIIEEVIETKRELNGSSNRKEIDEWLDIIFATLAVGHLEEFSTDDIAKGVIRSMKKFADRGWLNLK